MASTKKTMLLNIGPAHPAMHGVIRLITELEGETVVKVEAEIGYLHRAFEKSCENSTWNQAIPYTDRLNYVSPLINNFGYCAAVEKLMGIKPTERCQYIRVLMSEISRITDHLTCIAASAMELGAMTAFLYFMKAREYLYDIIEEVTGARLTISYGRDRPYRVRVRPPCFFCHGGPSHHARKLYAGGHSAHVRIH